MARSRGILYVVATPIGNLQDLTQRAGEVLAKVELVAAEDTRRTRKLLTHLGIRVRLVSYREHNRDEAARSILAHLGAGRNAALVTDAGTPGVSDPGYHLVDACVKQGITVIPVPGASALAAALSVSGMPMDRFVFEGFLPSRAAARRRRLEELGATGLPFVAYESPRRIASTLSDIARTLGKVQVVVAREMTKVHEEFLRGDAQEVGRRLREERVLGEITLLVAAGEVPPVNIRIADAARRLRAAGLSPSRTASLLADLTGVDRKTIYRQMTGDDRVRDTD